MSSNSIVHLREAFGILGLLSGFVLHHGVFIHGEWHMHAPTIMRCYGLLLACLMAVRLSFYSFNLIGISSGLVFAGLGHVLGLMASICVYRLLFHRLNKSRFPGPFWARFTKLGHVWECRDSKNHLYLHKLYKTYGDFVRTGPAEVTVFRPESLEAVAGRRSECVKAEFYDLLWPEKALFAARDRATHTVRRRDWMGGFSAQATIHHDAKILQHIEELDRQLRQKANSGEVINVTDFFLWFTFDMMGNFTFSKSLGMLENQKWHDTIAKMKNARVLLGPLAPTPWLLHLGVKLLPRISWVGDWYDSVDWCQQQIEERLSAGTKLDVPDLTSYFMENKTDDQIDSWLRGDSLLAILAGSEPTAQALTAIFHELALHPEHVDKIREELGEIPITDSNALAELPHLNAVIQEAMRLHPSLITGGIRKTTDRGVMIGDVFIPPHVAVVTPLYTISRREDCFERGTEFIPERWTTRPDMVRNASAHIPFSIGRYNCIGQHLAMRIMRYTVSRIAKNYNFSRLPGDDGHEMESDKADRLTAFPGRVALIFQTREKYGSRGA